MTAGKLSMKGSLGMDVRRARAVGLGWKLRNLPNLARGWFGVVVARLGTPFGLIVPVGRLYARLRKGDGTVIDYGLVGTRVVTTAFVNFVVDQLQTETSAFGDFKYHDSGTGVGDEAVGDTGLGTESTVQVDDLREVGSQEEGATANIYKSIGTIEYDGSAAITEHGLFNDTRAGGGVLMDRTKFAAINVANGDSITFTYQLTLTAGS
jgi:hypothetical protein